MGQEEYQAFNSIKYGFERLKELGKLIPFAQSQIDMYGENITAKEIKQKMVDEFCNLNDKLLTYCKDIRL